MHLVGSIIRIYHEPRSSECQNGPVEVNASSSSRVILWSDWKLFGTSCVTVVTYVQNLIKHCSVQVNALCKKQCYY